MKKTDRRTFIKYSGITAASLGIFGLAACGDSNNEGSREKAIELLKKTAAPLFKISLAEWSLNKAHFDGSMSALDFAQVAKKDFGLDAIEYVNQFFMDKARDKTYLADLKTRADGEGVQSLLIMCDREGDLGATDNSERKKAVENHFKWVEAAKFLGCHSIRVNAAGKGSEDEVAKAAVKGLRALSTFAKDFDLNVIVENHDGYSSDGGWLSKVIRSVNMPNCGTLPDFGNFCIEYDDPTNYASRKCVKEYDRYKGVTEMMPFAKAVSAKSFEFDADGNAVQTDFKKMMEIVVGQGYNGYVGIEYEGDTLSEKEGILKTIRLLEKVREEMS